MSYYYAESRIPFTCITTLMEALKAIGERHSIDNKKAKRIAELQKEIVGVKGLGVKERLSKLKELAKLVEQINAEEENLPRTIYVDHGGGMRMELKHGKYVIEGEAGTDGEAGHKENLANRFLEKLVDSYEKIQDEIRERASEIDKLSAEVKGKIEEAEKAIKAEEDRIRKQKLSSEAKEERMALLRERHEKKLQELQEEEDLLVAQKELAKANEEAERLSIERRRQIIHEEIKKSSVEIGYTVKKNTKKTKKGVRTQYLLVRD